jgi:sulfhydrogenase subunit beta (sulfur reductase)
MTDTRDNDFNPTDVGGDSEMNNQPPYILESEQFQSLIDLFKQRGYRVLGSVVRDKAIVYDDISSVYDFPVGWSDQQEGGTYRLTKSDDGLMFNYTVGPQSWKKFLHRPDIRLWQAKRTSGEWTIDESLPVPEAKAFIGVRSCELHAIVAQDRVLLHDLFRDPFYERQRENNLIVAVHCSRAGGTCFCTSMNTGPKALAGFDLALTELSENGRHYFVVEAGSTAGTDLLKQLSVRGATDDEIEAASNLLSAAAKHMGRRIDTTDLKALLYRNLENPRFDHIARRCLTCGNCTMVCPTCFCTTIEDVTDLTGQEAERRRKWDSCFTLDYSYIHGGSIRTSVFARYRKWFTHKLATWFDQFGSSGCVGCGRCITWCPVGIDITEEVRAIRESERVSPAPAEAKE